MKKIDDVDNQKFSFNGSSSSFIKLKYYPEALGLDEYNTFRSTATVVADKINLLKTHEEAVKPEELIDDEAMIKLISKAHELPYGDVLIQFIPIP